MALIPKKIDKLNTMIFVQGLIVSLIFFFSAYATYNIAMNSFHSKPTACMLTIIIECAMMIFAYKYHQEPNTDKISGIQWAYAILWFIYLVVSIIFSTGSIMQELDGKEEQMKFDSPTYKQYLIDKQNNNTQIETFEARLKTLNGDSSTTDPTKSLSEITNKIANKRAELSNIPITPKTKRLRNDKENEISSLEKSKLDMLKATAIIDKSNTTKVEEIKDIYLRIDKLNNVNAALDNSIKQDISSKNPFRKLLIAMGLNEVVFWVILCILLEISRFFLLKSIKKESYTLSNIISNSNNVGFIHPQTVTATTTSTNQQQVTSASTNTQVGTHKFREYENYTPTPTKNSIGFKSDPVLSTPPPIQQIINFDIPEALDKDDVRRYIDCMNKNSIGDIAPGSDRIAKMVTEKYPENSMQKETARKIRALLEGHGIVKSDKITKKTVILKHI
jgi:hypothetical protein